MCRRALAKSVLTSADTFEHLPLTEEVVDKLATCLGAQAKSSAKSSSIEFEARVPLKVSQGMLRQTRRIFPIWHLGCLQFDSLSSLDMGQVHMAILGASIGEGSHVFWKVIEQRVKKGCLELKLFLGSSDLRRNLYDLLTTSFMMCSRKRRE